MTKMEAASKHTLGQIHTRTQKANRKQIQKAYGADNVPHELHAAVGGGLDGIGELGISARVLSGKAVVVMCGTVRYRSNRSNTYVHLPKPPPKKKPEP